VAATVGEADERVVRMAFIDFLLFQQVTLLIAAVLISYVGVVGWLAMRRNDVAGLKTALKSAAVPLGALGLVATGLGVWLEEAWPLPGSYNILFTDVYLLFGLTLVILAVSMALSLKLQYAGLFGLVAGGLAISYGWVGWHLGMTKDPFETFLLYAGFGMAGILSAPATFIADHFLAHPDGTAFAWSTSVASARRRPSIQMATRAAQPINPVSTDTSAPELTVPRFRLPIYITVTLLVFVVFMALAGIAALLYADTTLPAHLASAP
jgi:putative membrane protein